MTRGAPPWWVCFTHEGNPERKERARRGLTRGGHVVMYTPKRTAAAEDALALRMRYELKRRNVELPMQGPIALVLIFYRSDRRKVDEDNLRKLVMDAGNRAAIWHDDSQVNAGAQLIEYDRENPRTLIALAPFDGSFYVTPRQRRAKLPPGLKEGPNPKS